MGMADRMVVMMSCGERKSSKMSAWLGQGNKLEGRRCLGVGRRCHGGAVQSISEREKGKDTSHGWAVVARARVGVRDVGVRDVVQRPAVHLVWRPCD